MYVRKRAAGRSHHLTHLCFDIFSRIVPWVRNKYTYIYKWLWFRRRPFQMHFSKEKFCILIKMSLLFVPKGLINNNTALVWIMAWSCITEICAETLLARWAPRFDYNSSTGGQQGIWVQWLWAVTHEDAGWPASAWAPGLTQRKSFLVLRKTSPLQ